MYAKWGTIFAMLAVALIFVATALDYWTESARLTGSALDTSINNNNNNTDTVVPVVPVVPLANFRREFGLYQYTQKVTSGFSYSIPCRGNIKERNDLQRNSAGMIALLILSNLAGFWASFNAVLASTRSTILQDFKPVRLMAIAAFVFTACTWGLWLRSHEEALKLNNDKHCRFVVEEENEDNGLGKRTLGGSFALCIVSCFFYLVLFIWSSMKIKKMASNTEDANAKRFITLFIAFVAYTCIFVASCYNVWTESEAKTQQDDVEDMNDSNNGEIHIGTKFGVYTAFAFSEHSYRYNSHDYRQIFCPLEDTEFDGAGHALANAGRVTLGFAITAIFFWRYFLHVRMEE